MKRVLVTGARDWANIEVIRQTLLKEQQNNPKKDYVLVHGNARGADKMAAMVAMELCWEIIAVPADWKKYGRAAGPIRNRQMVEMNIDFCYAFHYDINSSKGTKDCLRQVAAKKIPGVLIGPKGEELERWR